MRVLWRHYDVLRPHHADGKLSGWKRQRAACAVLGVSEIRYSSLNTLTALRLSSSFALRHFGLHARAVVPHLARPRVQRHPLAANPIEALRESRTANALCDARRMSATRVECSNIR